MSNKGDLRDQLQNVSQLTAKQVVLKAFNTFIDATSLDRLLNTIIGVIVACIFAIGDAVRNRNFETIAWLLAIFVVFSAVFLVLFIVKHKHEKGKGDWQTEREIKYMEADFRIEAKAKMALQELVETAKYEMAQEIGKEARDIILSSKDIIKKEISQNNTDLIEKVNGLYDAVKRITKHLEPEFEEESELGESELGEPGTDDVLHYRRITESVGFPPFIKEPEPGDRPVTIGEMIERKQEKINTLNGELETIKKGLIPGKNGDIILYPEDTVEEAQLRFTQEEQERKAEIEKLKREIAELEAGDSSK